MLSHRTLFYLNLIAATLLTVCMVRDIYQGQFGLWTAVQGVFIVLNANICWSLRKHR